MTSPETHDIEQSNSWQSLDARLSRLEQHLGLSPLDLSSQQLAAVAAAPVAVQTESNPEGSELEASIGEFGLAWVGSIVFFLGVVFLITYTSSLGYRVISTALGYLAAAGLFLTANLWKTRASHLSRLLLSGSLLLLFYTTMRLHFFSPSPLIHNSYIVFFLLLIVVGLQFYLAVYRESQTLASVGILLGMITGLSDRPTSTPLVAVSVSVWLAIRLGWWRVPNAAIAFAHTTHLIWLLNNPMTGIRSGSIEHHNLAYLFLYAGIFSVSLLLKRRVSTTIFPRLL
jgi:uncharacterized membrane protein